jgi:hypothetical protein
MPKINEFYRSYKIESRVGNRADLTPFRRSETGGHGGPPY